MAKIDYTKEFKSLYQPSARTPVIVTVPAFNFLMIDGQGDPNLSPAYGESVSALYALAYALKFAVKKQTGQDYGVMPLEGLWWVDDMTQFDIRRKGDWQWTMMIMQPELVTAKLVAAALPEVIKKKGLDALGRVRFEKFVEGQAGQVLHLGPYSDEGPTVARLHEFIKENGHELGGKHHEIYLSDPNRAKPDKMRTIIRQPVK